MFRNVIVGILVLAISVNLLFLSLGDLTPREVGLLSTLLAILSIVGSWIVAHIYAEKSNEKAIAEVKELYQSNLRTYALNAAEKVNNVSLQLNRLAGYLQDALSADVDGSPKDTATFRIERINSAVHILHTLRSVNDTTLNDWRGVIDEELEEQKEERESREAEVQSLIDRVQKLETGWRGESAEGDRSFNREEMESLRKEVRTLVREVTGSSLGPNRSRTGRVTAKCPSCDHENSYAQYQSKDNIRGIRCESCDIELVSRYSYADKQATLEIPKIVLESLECPNCESTFNQELSSAHRAKIDHRCRNCGSLIRLTRISDKIKRRVVSQKLPISEELVQKLKERMPPQPWPTGTHKEVQADLGISSKTYQRAINELIAQGLFKQQIDGVLYEPGESPQV